MAPKNSSSISDNDKKEIENIMRECFLKTSAELTEVMNKHGHGSGSAIAYYYSVPVKQDDEGSKMETRFDKIRDLIKTLQSDKDQAEYMATVWEMEAKSNKSKLVKAIDHIRNLIDENKQLIDKLMTNQNNLYPNLSPSSP